MLIFLARSVLGHLNMSRCLLWLGWRGYRLQVLSTHNQLIKSAPIEFRNAFWSRLFPCEWSGISGFCPMPFVREVSILVTQHKPRPKHWLLGPLVFFDHLDTLVLWGTPLSRLLFMYWAACPIPTRSLGTSCRLILWRTNFDPIKYPF